MSRGKSGAEPAGLSQLNLTAAGIDVGASRHFVAVPADRAEQPVREFEAFTADLYRLAEWIAECGVGTVVMESTGVYWIPLFGVFEERGFQVMLVDYIKTEEAARGASQSGYGRGPWGWGRDPRRPQARRSDSKHKCPRPRHRA